MAETEPEMCSEYASVKFLLKQVYAAHSAKVKELQSEIQDLKHQLEESRLVVAKSECERCKKLEKAYSACKEEYKNVITEQTKRLKKFEEIFSDKAEGASENMVSNLTLNSSKVLEETVMELDTESPSDIENIRNAACENLTIENLDTGFALDTCENQVSLQHAEKSKDLCDRSVLDKTPSILEDVVLVPDTLEVSINLHEPIEDSKQESKSCRISPSNKVHENNEKENNVNEGNRQKTQNQNICKKRALGELALNEVLCSNKKLNKNGKLSVKSEVMNLKPFVSQESSSSGKESACKTVDQSGKWAELFQDFVDSTSVSKKNNSFSPSTSNDDDDFVPKGFEENTHWKSSMKKGLQKPSVLKSIKCTSRYKMTLEAPDFNAKRPNYKQTKLSKECFVSSKTSVENAACKSQDASTSCGGESLADVSQLARLAASNTTSIALNSSSPSQHSMSVGSETLCPLELIAQNQPTQEEVDDQDIIIVEELIAEENDNEGFEIQQIPNSFDRLPTEQEPTYKYKEDAVRNKSKRKQLVGFECKECENYYKDLGISDEEKKKRMKSCSRHRSKFVPPSTPENFWELEFPNTEECKARGYIAETQKVQLKSRRRKPLISA